MDNVKLPSVLLAQTAYCGVVSLSAILRATIFNIQMDRVSSKVPAVSTMNKKELVAELTNKGMTAADKWTVDELRVLVRELRTDSATTDPMS